MNIGRRFFMKAAAGAAASAPVSVALVGASASTAGVSEAVAIGAAASPMLDLLGKGFKVLLDHVVNGKVNGYRVTPDGLVEVAAEVWSYRNGEHRYAPSKLLYTMDTLEYTSNIGPRLKALLKFKDQAGVLENVQSEIVGSIADSGASYYIDAELVEQAFGHRKAQLFKRFKAAWDYSRSGYLNLNAVDRQKFNAEKAAIGFDVNYDTNKFAPLTDQWARAQVKYAKLVKRYRRFVTDPTTTAQKILRSLRKKYKQRFYNRKWTEYRWQRDLGKLQMRYTDYSDAFRRKMRDRWSRELATMLRVRNVVMDAAAAHWAEKPERVDGPYSNWRHEVCMRAYRRIDDVYRTMAERFQPSVRIDDLCKRLMAGEDVLGEVGEQLWQDVIADGFGKEWRDPLASLKEVVDEVVDKFQKKLTRVEKTVDAAVKNVEKL